MNIPPGYDDVRLYYWLWYNYQCHEASAIEFQRIFENIIRRAKPEFVQIRPYGKLGDRKADGLLMSEKTVFQVYSPDDLTQEKVVAKISEDLDGAILEWGDDLEIWTFVYNARRGLPPDVPKILIEKQKLYPHIRLNSISKEQLWEIASKLPIQQLSEVFGAPAGYQRAFLPPDTRINVDSTQNHSQQKWVVLIDDVNMPIDSKAVLDALKPDLPYSAPVYISPDKSSFGKAAEYQRKLIEELQTKGRHTLPARYAVYSLAPIPLIAHLGFLLTDSVEVRYFKFHLDTHSWKWPPVNLDNVDLNFRTTGIPQQIVRDRCEVAIRLSISARVWEEEVEEAVPGLPIQIHISVDNPTRTWLRSEIQVVQFASVFRDVLTEIRNKLPRCEGIHLLFAGPAPIVLAAGQQVNPRMTPPVYLYEYSQQTTPRYEYALTLR